MEYSNKDLAAIHTAKFKEAKNSLAGAVKLYCKLFGGDAKELAGDIKAAGVKYNPAALSAINMMAKDKEKVLRVCSAVLPSVDGIFIKYVITERYQIFDGKKIVLESKGEDYLALNAVKGIKHKPLGIYAYNKYGNNKKPSPYHIVKNVASADGRNVTVVTTAVRRTTYTLPLIAKCIGMYLSADNREAADIIIDGINNYSKACLDASRLEPVSKQTGGK